MIYILHISHASSKLFLLHLFGSSISGFFLYIFTSKFGPHLFFLAARLIRDEDTYGEVPTLRAVLVLHQDAVLATVRRVDAGDEEVGELARLELEDDVSVRRDLFVVLQPGDLWHGVAGDVAGKTESLVRHKKTHRAKMILWQQKTEASLFTFPSCMVTTSGRPPATRARPVNKQINKLIGLDSRSVVKKTFSDDGF